MKIENNIIKYYLKNVFFISGNACAGKTTMAKALADKYGFYLYDMDKQYPIHRAIADEKHQPDMCYHGKNFDEQFMRPIPIQASFNISMLKEQSEMVYLDLIKLSENKTVIADVIFMPDRDIIEKNHIIFLTTDYHIIREVYFNRPEKREFYEFIKSKPNAGKLFDNIFKSLEETNRLEKKMISESGYFSIERKIDSTIESTLLEIESYFHFK